MLRLPDAVITSLADLVLGLPKLAAHRTRPQTQLVQYELLVTNPDEETGRLLTGLGCDPAVVESSGMRQADYLRSSSFGDRKILERNAVDQSSVKAWQSQLSVEEMQTVTDLVGAELLLELGYEQELLHAQQAGVLDRGGEVTELYRQIFRTWWDLRSTKAGALSGPSHAGESVHTTAAQLQQALLASEADRATGLDAIRNRDAAIEMLRGEVARLHQILNIP
ncbi:NoeE-like protein [Bradyrhizobium zhanjiangense]|uniref:NoeE-like protein n=2 Tax=Bradyrhizobium zhanjiangense TaxID=1325107 RepID=A0A4Q0SJQ5_9BRAD|nr:NoeE-like protein [Bradyrhizobium zhanjiangense]